MPELPEVETITRGLSPLIVGQTIKHISVKVPKLFYGEASALTGLKIKSIKRRAKMIVIELSTGYLLIHLKMTGQLIYLSSDNQSGAIGGHPDKLYGAPLPHKYTHIIIELTNGILYFNDLRKFGWIKSVDQTNLTRELSAYGKEYDDPEMTTDYLLSKASRRPKLSTKSFLLDQKVVTGLGNIYSDEVLFYAGIRPTHPCSQVTKLQMQRIHHFIPIVFELALKHGGSSSRDYRRHDGTVGKYLDYAKVYHRYNLPCLVCGTPIDKTKISGRTAHFCPKCQS